MLPAILVNPPTATQPPSYLCVYVMLVSRGPHAPFLTHAAPLHALPELHGASPKGPLYQVGHAGVRRDA